MTQLTLKFTKVESVMHDIYGGLTRDVGHNVTDAL